MIISHKNWAYFLMRISLGLIFLFYGLGKLMMGVPVFTQTMVQQFAKTPLPIAMVRLFSSILPFAEVTLGVLIMLGLFTPVALSLAAFLLMALTVGVIFLQQPATVAANLIFSLTVFFLIFFSEHNGVAVDQLWTRRRVKGPGESAVTDQTRAA